MLAQLGQIIRELRRSPAFSLVAITTLAIAIAANTAIYSVTDAVLLRSLPFPAPDRLAMLWERHPIIGKQEVALPDFRDWQNQNQSFTQLAAYTMQGVNVPLMTGAGEPEPLQATAATPNLFNVVGVQPLAGRAFRDDEDRPGHNHVVMLSHKLWTTRFGADRNVLGRSVTLDGEPYTIIGILAPGSAIPRWADIWLPLEHANSYAPTLRAAHILEVIGRLRPQITLAQADTDLRAIAARLSREYPVTNGPTSALAISAKENFTGHLRNPLLLLQSGAALVLLICCANLAILGLVRTSRRRTDIEIQVALGASPIRLFSASFSEAFLIAIAGGLLGITLARAIVAALEPRITTVLPFAQGIHFDWSVVAFVLSLSLATALIFGLLPSIKAMQSTMLRGGSRNVVGRTSGLMSRSVIAAQTALAVVVLACTGLLAESFRQILRAKPGFETTHLIATQLSIPGTKYRTDDAVEGYFKRLTIKLAEQPQVRNAAAVSPAPLVRGGGRFWIDGRPDPPPNQFPVAQFRNVTPGYFDVVGLRLFGGRLFNPEGELQSVVIVNRAFERRFFGDESAVGHSVLQGLIRPPRRKIRIIGVVSDARDLGLEVAPEPTIYWLGTTRDATLLVRTTGDANTSIRDTVRAVDSEVWASPPASLDNVFFGALNNRAFALELVVLFALASCLLAALGIQSVVANAVSERTREIGLRLAVGALPSDVVTMFVRRNLIAVVWGLVIGIPVAVIAARVMRGILFGVTPTDPRIYAAVIAATIGMALTAAWLPARRAANVDPVTSLRRL